MAKKGSELERKHTSGILLIFFLSTFTCAAVKLSSLVTLQLTMHEPVCLLWAVPHDQPCCARRCPPTCMCSFTLAADPEHTGKMSSWHATRWLAGFTRLPCRPALVCPAGMFPMCCWSSWLLWKPNEVWWAGTGMVWPCCNSLWVCMSGFVSHCSLESRDHRITE